MTQPRTRPSDPFTLIQITPLPQLVPSRVCLSCFVCCRFPEADSFLRPYFTADEISRAVAHGVDPSHFSDPGGCQVSVVPNPAGEGYLCPAFDSATSHCRIYDVRPLDCQIYPLAVMWNADESQVVLGWDSKCPFVRDSAGTGQGARGERPDDLPHSRESLASRPSIEAYAEQIAELIERDDTLETFASHPRLVGPFQDDVVVLRALPRLTERLRVMSDALRVTRDEQPPIHHRPSAIGSAPLVTGDPLGTRCSAECNGYPAEQRVPSSLVTRPLTLADRPRFERALASVETPLSSYAFAPHFIWRELFSYSWAEIEGHLCLFAEHDDGSFMPLPPLPLVSRHASPGTGDPLHPQEQRVPSRNATGAPRHVVETCFAFMRARNHGSAISRVENIPEELKPALEALGYRLRAKDPDYLYRASDLAGLAGDRYKSQRAAYNRFLRAAHQYEPYQEAHRDACLALYRRWVAQQEANGPAAADAVARHMLKDAASAHREALTHREALGLVGRIVWVEERLSAYTFGYERSPSVFCVLLEVADRSVPGLAQFIFREFCREVAGWGYEHINTMDDSGLPSLARSKRASHPIGLVPSYIATEPPDGCEG